MLRLLAALIVLTLTAPAAADAFWGGQVPLPPPVAGLTIQRADCPGYEAGEVGGCADLVSRILYLPDPGDRFAYLHEYGHVWEHVALTDADRAWFTPLLGFRPGTPWSGEEPGVTVPGEIFADAFATCHMRRLWPGGVRRHGVAYVGNEDAYGWAPTLRQHRRVCNAIAVLALVRR